MRCMNRSAICWKALSISSYFNCEMKGSVIPNSNYIIMVGDWNCLIYCFFRLIFVL
jgi:hypothetical protein